MHSKRLMHSRVAVVVVVIVGLVVEVVVVVVIVLVIRVSRRHFLVSMCLCLSTCFFLLSSGCSSLYYPYRLCCDECLLNASARTD